MTVEEGMEIRDIGLSDIRLSDSNTRKDLDAGTEDTSIDDLANSIRENGLLSPIIVRATADGRYDLIAGQRRVLAYRTLNRTAIPAIIRNLDDTEATIVSLVENVQRADMNPLDKARAFKGIRAKVGDDKGVAQETGVTVRTIRRYLALLNLAPSIQDAMAPSEGKPGEGIPGIVTLELLSNTFPAPEDQEKVLSMIGKFPQRTQQEVLKESGGNLDKIPGLVDRALEGDFQIRTCREGFCFDMPEELKMYVRRRLTEEPTSANGTGRS